MTTTAYVKYFKQNGALEEDNEKGSSFSCHFKPSFMKDVP